MEADIAPMPAGTKAARTMAAGVGLRAHAKSRRSPEIALMQVEAGGVGLCARKVAEAEAMVRGGCATS